LKTTNLSKFAYAAVALTASTLTIGCGLSPVTSTGNITAPAFKGIVMGGRNPIIGATVKIYATTSTGYGAGSFLQEANQAGASAGQDTDASGSFTFAGGYTCPSGQFAYLVSSGGNTGGGVNSASVLVAALGSCSSLFTGTTYTGTFIVVDEVTTVAAAYALGNFASVTGTGASAVVGIGAPSTNNATTGSATAAAGLLHAFQNAANLADYSSGQARTAAVGNASAVVPQALINSIANTALSCVNSAGPTSGGCPTLFGATTSGGTAPTNVFSALVNLAKNPTLNSTLTGATAVTSTAFLAAGASANSSFYSPNLSAATAPADWSIGIDYPSGQGAVTGTQGLTHPTFSALDTNDVYYVGNQDAATAPTTSNLGSFDSNGTLIGFTPNNLVEPSVLAVTADALGNVYQVTGVAATPALQFASTSGTLSPTSVPITSTATVGSLNAAVDRANNLWISFNSSTVANLYEMPAGSTAATATAVIATPAPLGIGIDPDQNIWLVDSDPTKQNFTTIYENTGTSASPAYNGALVQSAQIPGKDGFGIAFIASTTTPYVAYVTASKLGAFGGYEIVTPTISGAAVTAASSTNATAENGTPTKYTTPKVMASDGGGRLFTADNTANKVLETVPGAAIANTITVGLTPCVVVSGACTNVISGPLSVVIDSTGSVWATSSIGGNVLQIIGTANPTWPLLAVGKVAKP
jgi:hypothetical protein